MKGPPLFRRAAALHCGLALLGALLLWPSVVCAVEVPPQTELDPKRIALIADDSVREAVENLYSADPFVRCEALRRLYRLPERCKPALPWILAALGDDEYEGNWDPSDPVYKCAQDVLIKMGSTSEAALIGALREENPKVRERSAQLLGEMKSRAAIGPLLALVRDAGTVEAWGAIRALGALEAAEAVPALIDRLRSQDVETRRAAVNALGKLRDERAVGPLLDVARGPRNLALSQQMTAALYRIDGPGFKAALKLLEDPDRRIRESAVRALTYTRDPRLIDPLVARLDDEYIHVQGSAARALEWIVEHRGADVAVKTFARKDAYHEVRQEALRVLAKRNHPNLVQFLREGLADKSVDVQQTAVGLLRHKPDRRLGPELVKALTTASYNGVRSDAAEVLGELGDQEFVEPLLASLNDPSPLVRVSATKSLGMIGDPRAIEPLLSQLHEGDYGARSAAAQAASQFDDPRVAPALIAAIDREKDRLNVIFALGRVRGPKVLETLIKALGDKDNNVGYAAERALVKRSEPELDGLLQQAAREGDDALRERIERIIRDRRSNRNE